MSDIDPREQDALMAFAQRRLREAEASVDPMTAVRLAAARRRALDVAVVPQPLWRRAWPTLPAATAAALALVLWAPWNGVPVQAAPSADTLEWLAQDDGKPVPVDLYEDLDLVIWLEGTDDRV